MEGRELDELRRRAKKRVHDRSTALTLLEWNVGFPLPDVARR